MCAQLRSLQESTTVDPKMSRMPDIEGCDPIGQLLHKS